MGLARQPERDQAKVGRDGCAECGDKVLDGHRREDGIAPDALAVRENDFADIAIGGGKTHHTRAKADVNALGLETPRKRLPQLARAP